MHIQHILNVRLHMLNLLIPAAVCYHEVVVTATSFNRLMGACQASTLPHCRCALSFMREWLQGRAVLDHCNVSYFGLEAVGPWCRG